MIRILLAHEETMFHRSIKRLLSRMPDAEVVADTQHLSQLPEMVNTHKPDVLIVGFSATEICSTEIIERMKHILPGIKIMAMYKDAAHLDDALAAGADAYLLHGDMDIEILSALRLVRNSETYLSTTLQP